MSLSQGGADRSYPENPTEKQDIHHLNNLAIYAAHLLKQQTDEFASAVYGILADATLLRFFKNLSPQESIQVLKPGISELLSNLANHQAAWLTDKYLSDKAILGISEITTTDIPTISFVCRKAFRAFLPTYTTDISLYDAILNEIDLFLLSVENKAQQALFQAKTDQLEFINNIENSLPGAIYIIDLKDFRQLYTSRNKEDIFGYTAEEVSSLTGYMLTRLLHPDDAIRRQEYIRNFADARDGEIRNAEFRIKHKNGDFYWQRVYETVFKRDNNGNPLQIIGLSLNIDQEKETALRLHKLEQKRLATQESGGTGSFEWDLQGGESFFSLQLQQLFNLQEPPDYLSFLKHVHPADQSLLTNAINEAITGKGSFECEYRFVKDTEKIIWARGEVIFEDGRPLKMRGSITDITEQHLIMQQLEETIELHKQAQALTHIGNWTWDIPRNKISWSDEMYRIYGLEPQSEEIHFERFISLVHPEDRNRRVEEIQRALASNSADDYVLRIQWDDGTIKILQGKGEVITDETGKPIKLAGTCQDVTEQFSITRELEHKNIELQRRNEELTAFNYIASHDLQEPLRKIKLFSNRIYEKEFEMLPPVAREFLPRIMASTEQMQKLFNDLLAFSRATLSDNAFEKTDLNKLLEEVKTSLRDSIEEKQAIIINDPLPKLSVIPYQYQQLLENIISNAIKYSRPGMPVEIRINSKTVTGKNYRKHGAVATQSYQMLSITDNGIGFDQQYAEKIFELFQRLHNKNEYSGTGIGLAICKKIIQNHQGFITATSHPDAGATFNIFVPVG